jgi:hypothetical protein
MTGRACAQTWRPGELIVYCCCSASPCASSITRCSRARCSARNTIVDTIVILIAFGLLAYRYTRTNQMVTQYHWLYEGLSR